jgi:hypothetical protein
MTYFEIKKKIFADLKSLSDQAQQASRSIKNKEEKDELLQLAVFLRTAALALSQGKIWRMMPQGEEFAKLITSFSDNEPPGSLK